MTASRLYYIDVLRTLAILFIIFRHLPIYSYGETYSDLISVRSFTSMIQLPLLLFISGFLYSIKWIKDSEHISTTCIGAGKIFRFLNLGKCLLVPMLAWGVIYCIWHNIPFTQALQDPYKAGASLRLHYLNITSYK